MLHKNSLKLSLKTILFNIEVTVMLLVENMKGIFKNVVGKIGSIFNGAVDFFKGIPARLSGLFTNILPNWAIKLLGMDATKDGGGVSDGGSIDDGIVQNGKVIGTLKYLPYAVQSDQNCPDKME